MTEKQELTAEEKQVSTKDICSNNYLNITIENDFKTLKELINNYDQKYYKEKYQRKIKWEEKKQISLIESILLNIPLPSLFFFKKGNKLNIIDGQQRLNAIKNYLDNKLELKELEILGDLHGKKYSDLDVILKNIIDNKKIHTITINLDKDYKDEKNNLEVLIFTRLNTGGVHLTKTEIRNAIYCDSQFHEVINKIRKDLDYKYEKKKYQFKIGKDIYSLKKDTKLEEMVASYFNLKNEKAFDEYDIPFKNLKNIDAQTVQEYAQEYIDTLKKIYDTFTLNILKKNNKSPILLIKLDIYMQIFAKYKEEEIKLKKDEIEKLFFNGENIISRKPKNITNLLKKVDELLKKDSDSNA